MSEFNWERFALGWLLGTLFWGGILFFAVVWCVS